MIIKTYPHPFQQERKLEASSAVRKRKAIVNITNAVHKKSSTTQQDISIYRPRLIQWLGFKELF